MPTLPFLLYPLLSHLSPSSACVVYISPSITAKSRASHQRQTVKQHSSRRVRDKQKRGKFSSRMWCVRVRVRVYASLAS
ncbi:hypothetical protein J3F84DRAFT_202236 [Trichoderma pleuroticola]